ncbi:MAG: AMP-binding protein [Gammaproteobacteria bacterium]
MLKNFMEENQLKNLGIAPELTAKLTQKINHYLQTLPAEDAWNKLSKTVLTPELPFKLHLELFTLCYPDWQIAPQTAAAWIPDDALIQTTHLGQWMSELNLKTISEFHAWTVKNYEDFWQTMLIKLPIKFSRPPKKICDLTQGIEFPVWLPDAKLNIVDSCLQTDPAKIAVLVQKKSEKIQSYTYGELNKLSNRIANSLTNQGFKALDAIAIDMPMNYFAVAIYLGIIKMGGVVVSIADSFSKDEIATRLRIANAKGIFTQDFITRDKKSLALYEKVIAANAPRAILLSEKAESPLLRPNDISWENFLVPNEQFKPRAQDPMSHCNILFSSGTTGDPKAIPWMHTTAIKAASDAYLNHNIGQDDILAWPTNLGWMMGPWLIFAALINHATMALYEDVPREREFGQFIQDAKVTMLGVVPTLVSAWHQSHCMEGLDWSRIKCFSSTGECSNPEDMLYLMSLAGYKPIIEYCGGTEIGGAYLSSTLAQKNYPSMFTTPTFGLDLMLLDETGQRTENGEIAIIPPSIGLSTELLNQDHHKIYYENMPLSPAGNLLRRHGDQAQHFETGGYCVLGRVDDTMNLGGIKVSSAEIERVLVGTEDIIETAAIAVTLKQHGPSYLVIFAAASKNVSKENVKKQLQMKINQHLNPLFKIHDVVLINELPKTASNKIMRRVLRKQYQENVL